MRIFLASTTLGMPEQLRDETVRKCKPLYILETFFNGEKACLKAMNDVGNKNFLLDSGAFSYMNGAEITLDGMENYVDRYIKFIIKHNVKYFFEIDVDNIFGIEAVERWRYTMERRIGRQCIPVWHKERGVEYWKKMCHDYKYIAIGGLVNNVKKHEYESIKKLVAYANRRGVKVHGLGFTKTKVLKEYEWYSVDSSSWNVAAIRGQIMFYLKNGVICRRKVNKGAKKVNLGKLVAHNMIEWTKYQKFMENIRI